MKDTDLSLPEKEKSNFFIHQLDPESGNYTNTNNTKFVGSVALNPENHLEMFRNINVLILILF